MEPLRIELSETPFKFKSIYPGKEAIKIFIHVYA